MESVPDLARLLAANHGVVSRSEALELGLTPDQIRGRVRSGRWIATGPSVYRASTSPDTWEARARAAALSCRGLVSHTSALRVWGVDGWAEQPGLEVTIDARRDVDRPDLTIHRSATFSTAMPRVIAGIPVTGIERAVLDAAALAPDRIDQIVDAVVRQRLTTLRRLTAVVDRSGTRGRKEAGSLRRLLAARDPRARVPDSRFNRLVAELLVDRGLPQPALEYEIRTVGGAPARVDIAYRDHRLAIELDSAPWHHNSRSFVADPRRRNRLLLTGWRVLNFTWDDYASRPAELVATVAAALGPEPVSW